MKQILEQRFQEVEQLLAPALECCAGPVARAAGMIIDAYQNKHGLFLFGNGGSAADAQHLAGELNGRFMKERRPLKAQALVGDASVISCIANDYGYEQVFARQLQANAEAGDVAFGFSTSGNSKNVLEAFKAARAIGVKTIAMTGQGGGLAGAEADVLIEIPSAFTPHVQEVGLIIYHCLCEQIEQSLFG